MIVNPKEHEAVCRQLSAVLNELDDLHFRLGEAEHSLSGMYNKLDATETLLSEANLRAEAISITLDATEELLGQVMLVLGAIQKHAQFSGLENRHGDWAFVERIAREALELRQFEG